MSRSYLQLSLAALMLATSIPAVAARKAPASQSRPYVETSYLIAPKQVGDFELEGASYDANQKYSGAGFRYMLKGHQETRFDVYVYPAGRLDPASAVDDGMKGFRYDIAQAVKQNIYTQVQELHDSPFPLSGAEPEDSVPANDIDAAVMKAIADTGRVTGHKLQMRFNLQPRDWPMYSSGYLFYKQLYYFKLRASAAQERITQESFDSLTDLAARTLIPALQVANVGECANATIYLNPDATPEQGAVELVRQSRQHQGYNCHSSAGQAGIEQSRRSAEVIEITYAADEWKSQ